MIMGANRENTLVVDFSVLPKRPESFAVQKFMYEELKLDLSDATNIHFHNVRNVVFVEMIDATTALQYHNNHHLKRVMKVDKLEFRIPVYVDDGAVNVRVHDLPPRTSNAVLKERLQHFGCILSISREMWKNYFPGVYNGVRVVRMCLTKPIPSYLTIDGETTLVTYRNQIKTCRICGQKSHPRQKCATSSKRPITTNKTDDNINTVPFSATDFPTLGDRQHQKKQHHQQAEHTVTIEDSNSKQIQSNNETNNSDTGSDSDGAVAGNNKRRLSTKRKENRIKRKERKTVDQGYQKRDEENAEEIEDSESADPVSPAITRSKIKQIGRVI